MKSFSLGDILSITTGRLVSERLMDGVYDILNYMTGESLFTHVLPRAADACKPCILEQYPQLAEITGDAITKETWQADLASLVARYGNEFPLKPLAEWESKNPVEEMAEKVGADRVIVVAGGDS